MILNENRALLDMRKEPELVLLRRLHQEAAGFFEEFDSVPLTIETATAISFIAGNIEGMRKIVIILNDRAGKTPFSESVCAALPAPPLPAPAPPSIPQPKPVRRLRLRIAAAFVRKARRGARIS